jgi:hypothetical protein
VAKVINNSHTTFHLFHDSGSEETVRATVAKSGSGWFVHYVGLPTSWRKKEIIKIFNNGLASSNPNRFSKIGKNATRKLKVSRGCGIAIGGATGEFLGAICCARFSLSDVLFCLAVLRHCSDWQIENKSGTPEGMLRTLAPSATGPRRKRAESLVTAWGRASMHCAGPARRSGRLRGGVDADGAKSEDATGRDEIEHNGTKQGHDGDAQPASRP